MVLGRSLREFFQNDATGKLDYRFLLGLWFAYVLGEYVRRSPALSDWAFIALCTLQALYIYGPSADLANYFKATFGGFQVPQSQTVNQTNVGTDSSTVNGDAPSVPTAPIVDINSAVPNP